MNININPKKVLIILLSVIFSLLLINILGIISKYYFGHPTVFGLVPLFDFNTEGNIPTFYSSLALLVASILLLLIANVHKISGSDYASWLFLAIALLYISADEMFMLHERIIQPSRIFFNATGYFYFSWVIPYGIILVIIFISYIKFLLKLPRRIAVHFIISGTVFVSGGLGFELLGGKHSQLFGENNLTYAILYTCEEFLEMLGIVLFIYTLLSYMACQTEKITLLIKPDNNQ